MMVTGILSLSNAFHLGYPFTVVVKSLARMCDNVIVGVDPNFPQDKEAIENLQLPKSKVEIVLSPWELENRKAGSEIALQMDLLVKRAEEKGSDWVVVLQADEVFHDDDFAMLRSFMSRASKVNGFATNRLYFWKDLSTVRSDWCASLVRIFRPGTYSFMAEGTDKAGMYSGPVTMGEELELPYSIYHYSRVDSPEAISRRIRNLDSFFHPDEELISPDKIPPYDFGTREYDNYAKKGMPRKVKGKLIPFEGSHPPGIKEWYK